MCGRIIFEAFKGIADRHGFPWDFPTPEAAIGLARAFSSHPKIFGVVFEDGGQVVGSNFLDERSAIRGVGPITVDPKAQARGAGRKLMEAVLERGKGAEGIRLVQDAFNQVSYALYTSLGFNVQEPLVLMRGTPAGKVPAGYTVRPMEPGDLKTCAGLCAAVHGFSRAGELEDALKFANPFVAERGGTIRAYASAVIFWPLNHAVAETDEDLQALLLGAGAAMNEPLAFLLPTRRSEFFRWCLTSGLRGVKPMNLMSLGSYQDPRGSYYPSVEF